MEKRQLLSIAFTNSWASSIATDFPDHSQQLQSAVVYAEQQFTALYPNTSVTAKLTFAGTGTPTAALGVTSGISYDVVGSGGYTALRTLLPSLPTTLASGTQVAVPTIEARAVGVSGATTPTSDATITFANDVTWDFNPADRQNTNANMYDFIAVAEHEIAHALGRVDLFGTTIGSVPSYTPFDLYRYTASGSSYVLDKNGTSLDSLSTNQGASVVPGTVLYPGDPADWYPFEAQGLPLSATITKVNESGTIVNITATNSFQIGQEVDIASLTQFPDFNGPVTITAVSPSSFTYNAPPQVVTSANETGTTCNIVITNNFSVGQYVLVSGMQPSAYNGLVQITAASSGSFTYTAYAAPITAISESGTTVTATAVNSFEAGDSVVVAGISPAGFDGTRTILSASPTSFTYTAASGLGTGSGSGTATPTGLANATLKGAVTRYSTPLTTVSSGTAAQLKLDEFNAAQLPQSTDLSETDVNTVLGTLLGYSGISDSAIVEQESFLFGTIPVTTLYPGATYTANITLLNAGTTSWSGGGPGGTGYDLYYPGSGSGIAVGGSAVTPNGEIQFSFSFVAPASGNETFQMIHQGVSLFGEVAQIPVEGQGTSGAVDQQGQLTQFNVQENGVFTPMMSGNGFAQILAPNTKYYFQIQYENEGESDWAGAASGGTYGAWLIAPYTSAGGIVGGNSSVYVPTGAQINSVYDTSGTYGNFWTAYFTFQTGASGSVVQFGMLQQGVGYFGDVASFAVGTSYPSAASLSRPALASTNWFLIGQNTWNAADDSGDRRDKDHIPW